VGAEAAIEEPLSSGVDMGASALGRQRPPDAVGPASGKGAALSVGGDPQLEGDLLGERARIRAALAADVEDGNAGGGEEVIEEGVARGERCADHVGAEGMLPRATRSAPPPSQFVPANRRVLHWYQLHPGSYQSRHPGSETSSVAAASAALDVR